MRPAADTGLACREKWPGATHPSGGGGAVATGACGQMEAALRAALRAARGGWAGDTAQAMVSKPHGGAETGPLTSGHLNVLV